MEANGSESGRENRSIGKSVHLICFVLSHQNKERGNVKYHIDAIINKYRVISRFWKYYEIDTVNLILYIKKNKTKHELKYCIMEEKIYFFKYKIDGIGKHFLSNFYYLYYLPYEYFYLLIFFFFFFVKRIAVKVKILCD